MDLGLQNKNIIVTGGTRGIGLAAAAACAAEGANISICGRTQDSLDAATAALATHGTQIHGAICDIADAEQIKTYIAAAEAALGGIDGLVNNPSGFGNTDDEDSWARSMDIDVMGVVCAAPGRQPKPLRPARAPSSMYLRSPVLAHPPVPPPTAQSRQRLSR